ncbi:MAG: SET domain-containing protein-lysine N-methyltransferase [Nanoarchaeota archaeon]|nr:SET domain-containing protein-lysine N-methyltransferase [Nanoarchaeota archaeon]MBU0976811.1 SET domain-containing protein-lysine N-methyltransferase [Nanoarchaeota archaeon]
MVLVKRKSRIHGFGIFTENKILKGKIFYKIPVSYLFNKAHPRFAFIGDSTWVNDPKILNWVNHSCDANTDLKVTEGKPSLVAKRNINADEEITCDYNNTEKGGTKIHCRCGSKSCKGYFLRIK